MDGMGFAAIITRGVIVGAACAAFGCDADAPMPLPVAPARHEAGPGGLSAPPSARSVEAHLVASCDGYIARMRTCIESLHGASRAAARAMLDDEVGELARRQRDGESRGDLSRACAEAASRAGARLAEACPSVGWD